MPLVIVAWLYSAGKVAEWFNHGKPLLEDPSSLYGSALSMVNLFFAMFITSLYSGMLNNSLTPEEYRMADWKTKLVDNGSELIVFALCVAYFFHVS